MDPNQSSPKNRFTAAPRERQWLLIGSLALMLFLLLAGTYWVMRPHYQVLFSDLRAQDAAAVVAELEKQKASYRLEGEGDHTAILVPGDDARNLRIKLMSGDLKLKSVVGMELFNNSDLGLTDFTQKVNYQRALQGELARTIMSLDEVDMARVHLTMPESSIFRNDHDRPKASVALFLHDGEALSPDTVRGIQRLVAAAVPQMRPADVTVVDARGIPMTGRDDTIDDPKFALKQSVELYYQRKIREQITPLLQNDKASVGVNADIDFDQISLTRESDTSGSPDASKAVVLPLPSSDKSARKVNLPPLPPGGPYAGMQQKTQRTVEQIVSAPGSIKRLSVSMVLERALPDDTSKSLQALVAATIGMDTSRGDVFTVAVRTPAPAIAASVAPNAAEPVQGTAPAPIAHDALIAAPPSSVPLNNLWILVGALTCGGLGIGLLLHLIWPRRAKPSLSESERKALAQRLQRLLSEPERAHAEH